MTDKKQMSRRKALAMIAGAGAAAGVGGAGTYSYLSDTESAGVSFQTGSLIVSIQEDGNLDFSDLDEGEKVNASTIICNAGTLPIRNIIISDVEIGGNERVAKALEVKAVRFGGVDVSGVLPGDENGNGIIDIHDVASTLQNGSLTAQSDKLKGLEKQNDTEGEKGECKKLEVVTQIDYSQLDEGLDGETVSITVNVRAEQGAI